MSASVVRANALRLPLPDQCVDLIVTSPPYFALRSYQDDDGHYDGQIGSEATPADFLMALWRVLDECWRVLKPSGSCWVNLGDKYAGSGGGNQSGLLAHRNPALVAVHDAKVNQFDGPRRYNQAADVLPKSVMGLPWRFALGASCPDPYRTIYDEGVHPQWINRRPLIWLKANGLPESVTDRTRANFEDWFMLTKQGRYFSAVDEIREPHLPASLQRAQPHRSPSGVAHQDSTMSQSQVLVEQMCNPLGKLPGSVWTISSEPLIVPESVQRHYGLPDHFAAFPQEWPRRIILGFSPSGICTACGEGRRPVADRTAGEADSESEVERLALARRSRQAVGGGSATTLGRRDVQYEVTGHACACPIPDAPTRPPLVIDPFGGTGTVAGVANALGRHGLSFDLSGSYCRLARWRIRESGHFAKTASRTDRDRQGSLFGSSA